MGHVNLKNDERVDQLYSNNIKIIQSSEVFSFSLDAVMLANFANIKKSRHAKIIDLCAGNGAVGLFVSNKTDGQIFEVEIQPRLSDMAERSVRLNDLEKQMRVYNADLKDSITLFEKESFDDVLVNPPYFIDKPNSKKNPNPYLAVARHEVKTNLEEVIDVSSQLLKTNGKMFMVHRPDRLIEIFEKMKSHRLAPKKVQFIYPKKRRDANMVLISAIKDGKAAGLKVESPIFVYDGNDYLKFIKAILYGK
ncbi:methyltransferase [Fructilactobacillus lindneri]|uniref:Methyltransferase small domain-containing protein n=2 Tax=Fructilactobacillus lindneri TaxID=53444 RepID=A0A0R2JXR7_9LACO|nr:tRNA1(Val) (adenine(37)-N6)-methyltransferase [Fructilactobacillus lindneri]ANZ58092.1 methyltransferase [Fructilactobacillus lindneri]ANZ59413.1 methyltransferase [Fructilactobacillus lindneri]KRN78909.1 hypothetical protein IV52_GL000313 [Fructilactobacillus lindneri DSM 20690 = JCM 11027]POG98803.1 methyltransferase [Fructilactobacillus lindneri]POH03076.1 methyltransferase [Fructilactobacillus lindneri]